VTSDADGRVPVRLRVGVTGHRQLPDVDAVRVALRAQLEAIVAIARQRCLSEIRLCAVSALAEGADQLFADVALELGDIDLEVVLPMPPNQYESTMSVPARDELMRLLSLSSVETIVDDANSAEEAFELAGRTVVERSDVLIAVWDGREAKGRGGTQHIVEFAEHGRYGRFAVPVVIIAPDGTTRRAVDSDIG